MGSPSVVSKFPQPTSRLLYFEGTETLSLSLRRCAFFVDFYPLHGIDLATCFGELTHFFICENDTCTEVHPLFPLGVSRLSESSLHVERTRWKGKISFIRPSSSTVSSCCFDPHMKKPIPPVFTMLPFETEKRHLEAFQLLSMWFWLVLESV